MRRLVPLLAVSALFALGLAVPAPPAAAQGAVGCQGLFPDTEFDTRAEAGPVVVYGSGIHPDMTARFAGEYANVVAWVEADIASLAGAEVCLFEDKIPLDAQALGWPEGVYLRAAAFGEQGLVALSALNVGVVGDAGKAGLIHIALWRASGGTYPQPFGDDVMGWYLGRDAGATEAIHSLYLRQQIGLREPWPPFPWTVSKISDPILWHPDFGRGGSGDFTAYVAAARRSNEVVEKYPRTQAVPQALKIMEEAYRKLELNDLANDAARVYALNYGEGAKTNLTEEQYELTPAEKAWDFIGFDR